MKTVLAILLLSLAASGQVVTYNPVVSGMEAAVRLARIRAETEALKAEAEAARAQAEALKAPQQHQAQPQHPPRNDESQRAAAAAEEAAQALDMDAIIAASTTDHLDNGYWWTALAELETRIGWVRGFTDAIRLTDREMSCAIDWPDGTPTLGALIHEIDGLYVSRENRRIPAAFALRVSYEHLNGTLTDDAYAGKLAALRKAAEK